MSLSVIVESILMFLLALIAVGLPIAACLFMRAAQ
jgi:hypothetical protein